MPEKISRRHFFGQACGVGIGISVTLVMAAVPGLAADRADVAFVTIGRLDWMAKNVDAATFQNGDPIPVIKDAEDWKKAGEAGRPAMTSYPGSANRPRTWGRLYNYAAVTDPRGVCPRGWRVPEDRDWTALEAQLGPMTASQRLRARSGWPSGAGSDDVGFAALPAGFRTQRGEYFLGDRVAYFWSATERSRQETTAHMLFDYDSKIFRIVYNKAMGMSLRCVRERP